MPKKNSLQFQAFKFHVMFYNGLNHVEMTLEQKWFSHFESSNLKFVIALWKSKPQILKIISLIKWVYFLDFLQSLFFIICWRKIHHMIGPFALLQGNFICHKWKTWKIIKNLWCKLYEIISRGVLLPYEKEISFNFFKVWNWIL